VTTLANEAQMLGPLPKDARAKVKSSSVAVETTEAAVGR
jgi:hypothetical protein